MNVRCLYRQRDESGTHHEEHIAGNQFEWIQIHSSRGRVLAGSKMYPMVPGAVYLIDSTKPHCTLPEKLGDYVRSIIVMNAKELRHFLEAAQVMEVVREAFENGGMCCFLDEMASKEADECFRRVKESTSEDQVLLEILKLVHILKNAGSDAVTYDRGAVGNALDYIEKNCYRNLSTAQIAEHLHISRFHLCHIFKESCGMTISAYILEKRLAMAQKLLQETDKTVTQVSEVSGFSDVSYFVHTFRKEIGCTPKRYREDHRAEEKI